VSDVAIAGRYRLDERLGAGSTSEVWAATDLELDRRVALKLFGHDADHVRFEREARAIAALAHPNICTLYAFGESEDRPFIVLEYLPGGSLDERMTYGQPLLDDETDGIARDLAAGLAHAHERGVVHRDLKPANVLFDAAGRAKLADFGLARLGDAPSLTGAGIVLGTAAYIAPEQIAGLHVTAAADVYSFGVILFRMLTGRLPFEADDAVTMAAMHRDRPPPSVFDFRPDAPSRLESLAFAALAKSPADRPPDGRALLAELGVRSRA
jgi:serine/threonine-protein kinase